MLFRSGSRLSCDSKDHFHEVELDYIVGGPLEWHFGAGVGVGKEGSQQCYLRTHLGTRMEVKQIALGPPVAGRGRGQPGVGWGGVGWLSRWRWEGEGPEA